MDVVQIVRKFMQRTGHPNDICAFFPNVSFSASLLSPVSPLNMVTVLLYLCMYYCTILEKGRLATSGWRNCGDVNSGYAL